MDYGLRRRRGTFLRTQQPSRRFRVISLSEGDATADPRHVRAMSIRRTWVPCLAELLPVFWLLPGCEPLSRLNRQDGALAGRTARSAECLTETTLSSRIRFATAAEGAAVLATEDEWARQLSTFDLRARMRTVEPISRGTFMSFLASTARDWTTQERDYWTLVIDRLSAAMAGLSLRVPDVRLIKTTGEDEFGFAYSRNRAVVLPQDRVDLAGDDPEWDLFLLAHEMFHLLSRENQGKLDALQELLGFVALDGIDYPPDLEDRRLSNPNPGEYSYDRALPVETFLGPALVVPVLRTDISLEEVIALPTGGPPAIFNHVELVLLPVDTMTGEVLRHENGALRMHGVSDTDWLARMQRNSSYVSHPNELLADNFALLIQWRSTGRQPTTTPRGYPVADIDLIRSVESILGAECK